MINLSLTYILDSDVLVMMTIVDDFWNICCRNRQPRFLKSLLSKICVNALKPDDQSIVGIPEIWIIGSCS